MKEAINPKIDWKNLDNKPAEHAHRYKDQLQHLQALDADKMPGFKSKEAQGRIWSICHPSNP